MDLAIKVTQREVSITQRIFGDSFDYYFKIDGARLYFKESDLDKASDTVSDYLIRNGFGKNDEPTKFGLEIENLQEKFLKLQWNAEK